MTNEKYNELLREASMALFHVIINKYPLMPRTQEDILKACAHAAKVFIDEIENLSRNDEQ